MAHQTKSGRSSCREEMQRGFTHIFLWSKGLSLVVASAGAFGAPRG